MTQLRWLALVAFFTNACGATNADKQKRDATDYSLTSAAGVSLPGRTGPIELRVPPEKMVHSRVCGKYVRAYDLTGGYALYLFPDGTAFLTEFGDVSSPKLVGHGRWEHRKGRITISWAALQFEDKAEEESYRKGYGDPSEFFVYVPVGEKRRMEDPILIAPEKREPQIKRYFLQVEKKVDWEGVRRELLKPEKEKR
jgi:hypothetical protein